MSRDLDEIAERFYPRRLYVSGWSPPRKETEPMTRKNWPEVPGDAEARRQEAADRREMDKLEELLTPPPDPELERLIAEQEARARSRANADPDAIRRELERRAGFGSDDEWTGTADEIAAKGRAARWPGAARAAYLAAIEDEKIARRATRSYGGNA